MAKVERHQRGQSVAQLVTHALEVPLEIQVMLETIARYRQHLGRVAANVPTILFADVHAEPMVAEFGFEEPESLRRYFELLPIAARSRTRHIAPDVKKEKPAAFQLVGKFAEVAGGESFREERRQRQKHRFYRKFRYLMSEYGSPFCVGCGRCSRQCVAGINIIDIANQLQEGVNAL